MSEERMLPTHTDVLVIGQGPVGAALGCLLGRQGVAAVVVDKALDILHMPRAIALDNEALRILQMAGLDESAFARIPIPEVRMTCPQVGLFNRVNTEGHIDGHPKLVTFYQPELERALRDEMAGHAGVSAFAGWELMSFAESGDLVSARLRNLQGEEQVVTARYLVGADGASSRIRTLIGQDFQGQTYSEDWLIVDAARREGKAIDHVEFICDAGRPTPHMPAPGGRERWEFMLQPGESREDMERPERIAELLRPWVAEQDLTIERKAVYRFHARCCESFSRGRVFLVGDAAHITPPFVGQGLVAGLRDVANLAWKLKWVLHFGAHADVLGSYDQERRPHARRMINLARFMGHMVMPSSRMAAIALHGGMRLMRLLPKARRFFEELGVKPANVFDRGLFFRNERHRELRSGAQLPQRVVRFPDGRLGLSDEAIGDALTLVGFGVDPCASLTAGSIQAWRQAGGQFVQVGGRRPGQAGATCYIEDVDGHLAAQAEQGWLVVCRPDRFILGMGPARGAARLLHDALDLLRLGGRGRGR